MASGTGSKCPLCGRTVAVGLVSQTLIQHEDKNGLRCSGSGRVPVVSAARTAAAARAGTRSATRPASAAKSSPATKGSLTVRKVEVDPEVLQERKERSERLRRERAEAARARNEVGVSYFDEPGV